MREIEKELGKIYEKDGFYYLEKIYNDFYDLIKEEKEIRKKAVRSGFIVNDYSWIIEENPSYIIESIVYDGDKSKYNENIFIFKLKLEYMR